MGFLFPDRRVTKDEMKKVRSELDRSGFTSRELDQFESLFHGDMDSTSSSGSRGVEPQELEEAKKYLLEHMGKHPFDQKKIDMIYEAMKRHL